MFYYFSSFTANYLSASKLGVICILSYVTVSNKFYVMYFVVLSYMMLYIDIKVY